MIKILSRGAAGIGTTVVLAGVLLAPAAAFAGEAEDGCAAVLHANADQTVAAKASGNLTRVNPFYAQLTDGDPVEKGMHYQASIPILCGGVSMRRILMDGHPAGRWIPDAAVALVDPLAGVAFRGWVALAPGTTSVNVSSQPADSARVEENPVPGRAYKASSEPLAGEPSMQHAEAYYAIKFDDGVVGFVDASELQKASKNFKAGTTPAGSAKPAPSANSTRSAPAAPAFLPGLIIGLTAAIGAIALCLRRRQRNKTTPTTSKEPQE